MKAEDITVEAGEYVGDSQVFAKKQLRATFCGPDHRERAEAEAQRMRDALPKPRFVRRNLKTSPQGNAQVFDVEKGSWVSEPNFNYQQEFPGLVQHICDWLNEQLS